MTSPSLVICSLNWYDGWHWSVGGEGRAGTQSRNRWTNNILHTVLVSNYLTRAHYLYVLTRVQLCKAIGVRKKPRSDISSAKDKWMCAKCRNLIWPTRFQRSVACKPDLWLVTSDCNCFCALLSVLLNKVDNVPVYHFHQLVADKYLNSQLNCHIHVIYSSKAA